MKSLVFSLLAISAVPLLAQQPVQRDLSCIATSNSGTAYTCSMQVTPFSYIPGAQYRFKADVSSTGAVTINFNSLGPVSIKKIPGGVNTPLIANDIQAGQWVDLTYDGMNMQMASQLGNSSSGGSGISSISVNSPLTGGVITSSGSIGCQTASSFQAGCISSSDWSIFNAKQATLTLPLSVANGGTGTASPGLVPGTNVTISGSWPNQTVNSTGAGSAAVSYVTAYGAVANMVKRTDGVCNSTTTFTSALGTFASGDTGKFMEIVGCNANGATWHGTITFVSPTQVTLSVAATASATALKYAYGTPSQAAFQSCVDGVGAYGTCLVPPPAVCPTNAVCGYIFSVTDQQTAHAPSSVKIRFPGVTLQGVAGRIPIACSGWPALYTNSTSHPGVTALIRGNCIDIGDQDGPLGVAGTVLQDVTVANLALDGMTTGNTFVGAFDPTTAPCSTTFDCWDTTNKGVFSYGGTGVNNIVVDNVWAHNFKGEIAFSGGGMGKARISNSDLGSTNADDISWSADDFVVEGNQLSNAWNAGVENGVFSTTLHHVYRGNRFSNIYGQGIVLTGVSDASNSGPLEILGNTFQQIASQAGHNGSTALTAIYAVGQIGTCTGGANCGKPSNVLVKGNSCLDCFGFARLITAGHSEVTNNTFGIDSAGLFNFMEFHDPQTDVLVANNYGFATASAIANSHNLTTVYLLNPGFGTLNWSGLKFINNSWNFTGATTQYYQFTISFGGGFAAVTNKYPIFNSDYCLGCGFSGTDDGQQDLSVSATVIPVGPEVHVFHTGAITATIDASKSQDSQEVRIVNTGSGAVTFPADSNMDLTSSVVLTTNQGAIFRFQASESKWVFVAR